MEDNGRIFKEAYRTCQREYDTLQKRYFGVGGGGSLIGLLKWMLPVLIGAALIFVVLYLVFPTVRPTLLFTFICVEAGLLLCFAAYAVYNMFVGSGERDNDRMNRLASIVDELDKAWVANDANEAAMRRINAERDQHKGSTYGVRSRVLGISDDEGEDR